MKWVFIVLVISQHAMSSTINLFWRDDSKAPYDVHAAGGILSTFNAAVHGQLIRTDEGFNLIPSSLQSFYYDYESKSYTLQIKKGLKFHNGREVTATDLEFTLTRGFYSEDNNFFRNYLGKIEGIDKVKTGSKFKVGRVSGIKQIDDKTLKVKLSTHDPAFLNTLTIPYFALVPREELKEKNYFEWKGKPIGTGPYKVKTPFTNRKTVLEKVNKKNKGADYIYIHSKYSKRVNYDIGYEPTSKNKVHFLERPAVVRLLEISNANELSSDSNFRHGLSLLLDRNLFQSEKLGISPSGQLLPKHFWGTSPSKVEFNLNKARSLFAKIKPKLLEKTYKIPVFAGEKLSEIHMFYVNILQKEFKKVGFKTKFYPLSKKFIPKEIATESPLYMVGRVSDYIDPLIMFSTYSSGAHNPFYQPEGNLNKRFNELYEKSVNTDSLDKKIANVRKLSRFVQENVLTIALAEEKIPYYYNPQTVKEFGKQPQPLTLFLENIELKENVK